MGLLVRLVSRGYSGLKTVVKGTSSAVRSTGSKLALDNEIRRALKINPEAVPYAAKGVKGLIGKFMTSKPVLRLRTSKLFQKFVNNKSVKFVTDDFGSSRAAIQKGFYEAGKEEGLIRKGTVMMNEINIKENPQVATTLAGLVSPIPFGSVFGYVIGSGYKYLRNIVK